MQLRQTELVEELKQSTNFYSTQALINRFDSANSSPNVKIWNPNDKVNQPIPKFAPDLPLLKHQSPTPSSERILQKTDQPDVEFDSNEVKNENGSSEQQEEEKNEQVENFQNQQMKLQPIHSAPPYEPKWYDRILDLIVGEDEYSPKSRYALICSNCFAHNGLAQPGELPESVVYICPKCGMRNGKPKNKRKNTISSKPDSTLTSTPTHKDKPANEESKEEQNSDNAASVLKFTIPTMEDDNDYEDFDEGDTLKTNNKGQSKDHQRKRLRQRKSRNSLGRQ